MLEGAVHVDVGGLAHLAFGLLDHDPAVEGLAELEVEDLGVDGDLVLDDGDSGDVGHALGGGHVRFLVIAPRALSKLNGRLATAMRPGINVYGYFNNDGLGSKADGCLSWCIACRRVWARPSSLEGHVEASGSFRLRTHSLGVQSEIAACTVVVDACDVQKFVLEVRSIWIVTASI